MELRHRVPLPYIVVSLTLTMGSAPVTIAQTGPGTHEKRFEMTEPFIRDQWRHPVRSLDVVPQGAGPVHIPADDCEIHVGAEHVDQSISDFVGLVLEPPNVCKDRSKSKTAWRAFYQALRERPALQPDSSGRGLSTWTVVPVIRTRRISWSFIPFASSTVHLGPKSSCATSSRPFQIWVIRMPLWWT